MIFTLREINAETRDNVYARINWQLERNEMKFCLFRIVEFVQELEFVSAVKRKRCDGFWIGDARVTEVPKPW